MSVPLIVVQLFVQVQYKIFLFQDCADPETGVVGKCCRDPNYVDPWPASQLGLYNPNDGFDNGQYKETRNQGQYKRPPASGVKGGPQPGVKGGRPPSRPFEPNQLGAASNIPGTYVRPDPNQGYPSQVRKNNSQTLQLPPELKFGHFIVL